MYISTGASIAWTDQAFSNTSAITWTNIGAGLPNFFITDIAVNPDDDTEIIVTLSGYTEGERVYKSNNSGATWENITGSLPAVPVNLKGGNNVTLNPGFNAGGEINFDAKVGPCPGTISYLINGKNSPSTFVINEEFHQ